MTNEAPKNEIRTLDYSLEWVDHLYAIYVDFNRRNDISEWAYFLGRPELGNPKECEKIAECILGYIFQFPNISQKIALILDDFFKYSRDRAKYEKKFSYGHMEFFYESILSLKEFPPYDQLAGLGETDPDEFLELFHRLYFPSDDVDAETYDEELTLLKEMEIEHPYMALLESELCMLKGEPYAALQWLSEMDECYHKNVAMGNIFFKLEDFDSAEACFEAARSLNEGFFDSDFIVGYVLCKWHSGKLEEALAAADEFAALGYEHDVLPLKYSFLETFSKALAEKAKTTELNEKELLIMKEYAVMRSDYEAVKRICRMAWDRAFKDGSWVTDMAEAYFETGDKVNASKITEMVYSGKKQLDEKHTLKIREIKARLFFSERKIKEAYDIMDNICRASRVSISQKLILAQMYRKTGRLEAALAILNELYYKNPFNYKYTYELSCCLVDSGELQKAHYLFKKICSDAPDYQRAAYYVVQTSIDLGEDKQAENELKDLSKYIPDGYVMYLNGQIAEMHEEYKEAQYIYKAMIERYEDKPYDIKLFNDAAARYFLMRQENGAKVMFLASELEKFLKKYPGLPDVWFFLGDLYECADIEVGAAEICYGNAIKADPYHGASLHALFDLYTETGKNEQAWELLNRLILYTDDIQLYLARAYAALDRQDLELCRHDISEYERRGGSADEIAELKAQVLLGQGEYEQALEAFESLMRRKGVKTKPYYDSMAICMCKCGRFDDAEALLDAVCQTSKNSHYHIYLYDIQMYRGKFREAKYTLKRFREVCGLGRLDDHLSLLSAMLMVESGKALLGKPVAETIADSAGERYCAVLEITGGNCRTSVKILKKLIRKEPGNIDNYSWLAYALYLWGKTEEAAEYAQKGLDVLAGFNGPVENINNPEILCQYAFLKTMCQAFDEAEEAFDKALSLPTCQYHICDGCYEAHFGKGILYGLKEDYRKASKEFDKSLEIRSCNYVCRKIRKWY